ncbi:hypothetical protein NYE37_03960 [Thermoactinomyces sp. FSL K6-2592]|jgi:hypothetical protein|uniref:hypothetical protein n=1 Tax=Thermoactinomyces TaxID=2023 RepID=UPI0030F5DAC0
MKLSEKEREQAALIAETVLTTLEKRFNTMTEELKKQIEESHLDLSEQLLILTSKVEGIAKKLEETEKATAYLAKDVLLLKNAE